MLVSTFYKDILYVGIKSSDSTLRIHLGGDPVMEHMVLSLKMKTIAFSITRVWMPGAQITEP